MFLVFLTLDEYTICLVLHCSASHLKLVEPRMQGEEWDAFERMERESDSMLRGMEGMRAYVLCLYGPCLALPSCQ